MSEKPDRKKARRMLLLLGAISLAPFAGSLLLYLFWKPTSFTNYGELLPVTPLGESVIAAKQGPGFRIADLRGKWVFLMADAAACDEHCKAKLYLMRQIRLTQGKDQDRIERLWLVTDGGTPAAELAKEYDGTRVVVAADDAFTRRLPAKASVADHVYILDPLGNLMMRFPRDPDLSRVKRDVSRLIKASSGWVQKGQ
jgi:hypothetical protein